MGFPRNTTLCLLVCVASWSCSPQQAKLTPIRGTVLVDGKPAAKVLVVFYRLNDPAPYPTPSSALTDDSGAFELTTAKQADGAAPGEYAVVFQWQNVVRVASDGEPTYSGPDKLGGRYGNSKKTRIRATVHPDKNEPLTFNLTTR
jgi:hypothetical protein